MTASGWCSGDHPGTRRPGARRWPGGRGLVGDPRFRPFEPVAIDDGLCLETAPPARRPARLDLLAGPLARSRAWWSSRRCRPWAGPSSGPPLGQPNPATTGAEPRGGRTGGVGNAGARVRADPRRPRAQATGGALDESVEADLVECAYATATAPRAPQGHHRPGPLLGRPRRPSGEAAAGVGVLAPDLLVGRVDQAPVRVAFSRGSAQKAVRPAAASSAASRSHPVARLGQVEDRAPVRAASRPGPLGVAERVLPDSMTARPCGALDGVDALRPPLAADVCRRPVEVRMASAMVRSKAAAPCRRHPTSGTPAPASSAGPVGLGAVDDGVHEGLPSPGVIQSRARSYNGTSRRGRRRRSPRSARWRGGRRAPAASGAPQSGDEVDVVDRRAELGGQPLGVAVPPSSARSRQGQRRATEPGSSSRTTSSRPSRSTRVPDRTGSDSGTPWPKAARHRRDATGGGRSLPRPPGGTRILGP